MPVLNLNPIIGLLITQHQQEPTLSDNNMIWTTRSRLTNKLPRFKKKENDFAWVVHIWKTVRDWQFELGPDQHGSLHVFGICFQRSGKI